MPASPALRHRTGVSLHGHTLHSRESFGFLYAAALRLPLIAPLIRAAEHCYRRRYGSNFDLARGWWTPPLAPYEAWKIERAQLEQLEFAPLISLTDHDDIEAPVSLRVLEDCREAPVSVEWTVPFGTTFFHLGIHNLPIARSRSLFEDMQDWRNRPCRQRLVEIVDALDAEPQVLIVFNHMLWDEAGIGQLPHEQTMRELLELLGPRIHALELNGLRPRGENRAVLRIASDLGKPVVSGGDRHGLEPGAIINVTNASSFGEFAEQIREGFSRLLFLPQYRQPRRTRVLRSLADIVRTYDRHPNGWRLWSDRMFYRCEDDTVRSVTDLLGYRRLNSCERVTACCR
jgi:hypothetical protein